ncbi:MAG: hypothetical protein HY361_02045, partial [Candidatus Aenigmarchaeota archaeon]|nr:hypothetical protein [Candidatus Aenigmarchaeota archaeon]
MLAREEKFVHALSIVWLQRYSQNFGITQQELARRFAEYERDDRFKGTNVLSQSIPKIGIQKAIEIYVKTPDALFKGIPNF